MHDDDGTDVRSLCAALWGEAAAARAAARLAALVDKWRSPIERSFAGDRRRKPRFDHRDVVLIAYGDHIRKPGEAPLQTLAHWCRAHVRDLVRTVHVLPFHPSTSYEGYAISDYLAVDPALGTWDDLALLHEDFALMFDLVLNHCSASHPWFRQFLDDAEPGRRYFTTVDDPGAPWLRRVFRARTSPLLHTFATRAGDRHVWTTYDRDLVDLDWREPDLCCEIVEVLFDAVARGARCMRLDAFVYLWKAPHTSCVNQPELRHILALLQRLLDDAGAGGVAVLPSLTNVSQADSHLFLGPQHADLIYHLPLSSLLLHALYRGDAKHLAAWLRALPKAPAGTAYLNLTACHDGVGLTWLKGLLPEGEIDFLIDEARRRGSLLSSRHRTVDDDEQPWEINATYFSACSADADAFLATQAAMLAVRGVPALYMTSLLAGQNDHDRVARTGDNRAVNRGRFDLAAWSARALSPSSAEARVLRGLQDLLAQRSTSRAFHPDGAMDVVDGGDPAILALVRAHDGERMLCRTNFSSRPAADLAPYETRWTRL